MGVMAAGSLISAGSSFLGGSQAGAQAKAQYYAKAQEAQYQAELLKERAADETAAAAFRADQIKRVATKMLGRQTALSGAMGVAVDGSVIRSLGDTRYGEG